MALGGVGFDKIGRPLTYKPPPASTPTPASGASAPAAPPSGAAASAPAAAPAAASTPSDNALNIAMNMLTGFGFDAQTAQALANQVLGWQQQNYDSNAISYLLTQTPEYKARFAGNDLRAKAGLPVLSPAEYLATEQSYRQIMQSYGIPKGFYDTPDSLAGLIGGDVSASELSDRVKLASDLVNRTDPTARDQLYSYYGIDSGHLIAHFLDQNVSDPILQKQVAAAEIGGAAYAQGLAATDKQRAETYAGMGVTEGQARQAYGQIAAELPTESQIAQRFGGQYTQQNAEDVYLGQNGQAQRARDIMNQKESNLFGGDTGLPSTLYGSTGRAAAIGVDTSGSY